jgi:hypothetical protein
VTLPEILAVLKISQSWWNMPRKPNVEKQTVTKRNLDLRLLMNGFKDYLPHRTGNAVSHSKVG